MREFSYHVESSACAAELSAGLNAILGGRPPVFVCIGSDAVIGDSLSPLVGSLLKEFYHSPCYCYGELSYPVTARELPLVAKSVRALHPESVIVALDASVGDESEIGVIRLREGGLYPGKGVGKEIEPIGDVSLLGVVSARGTNAFRHLELTRLRLIYRMATVISEAVADACG